MADKPIDLVIQVIRDSLQDTIADDLRNGRDRTLGQLVVLPIVVTFDGEIEVFQRREGNFAGIKARSRNYRQDIPHSTFSKLRREYQARKKCIGPCRKLDVRTERLVER